ncbi:MAG: molybdopterin-guanine dinucleotide biosynthesis protein MobB, partial [Desulfobulbales bacterium]|nr:molybdopterin-guanine dinucleotide biosynthesis protein MobB [Desulfobulbales bacterium]
SDATANSPQTNTVCVTSDIDDTNPSDDCANSTFNATNIVDVGVVKTVDTLYPGEGDTIVYTINVTNYGPIPVTNLVDLYFSEVDLVLTEGYKKEAIPKVEIFRSTIHADPLADPGETLIAMMSDVEVSRPVPRFTLEETGPLAEFLVENVLHKFQP